MCDYSSRAKAILEKIRYATVATASLDAQPWNSPVAYETDDDYVIYWFSDKESRHSMNVRENPKAFIVIYDSTVPEGEGECVYIEADVEELNDLDEINKIRNAKKGLIVNDGKEFLGNAVRRCYKATHRRVWMNDVEKEDGKFIRDYRVELNLLART